MTPRALRVLHLANDGASAGHVTRALAVARALPRAAAARGVTVSSLLVTTSAADRLLAWAGVPWVKLPDPRTASRAGWTESARRELAARVLAGAADAFAPDVLIADTFPCGPQLEARAVLDRVRWRVLVRRRVTPARAADAEVSAALDRYHAVLVPDDPHPIEPGSPEAPPDARAVPPITLSGDDPPLPEQEARHALGLSAGQQGYLLINCGGGGDPDAAALEERIAQLVLEEGRFLPLIARGPLAGGGGPGGATREDRVGRAAPVPLQPYVLACRAAIVAAGYNIAHELARARVPLALFARPRAFDDQAARVRRFVDAQLACELPSFDPAAVKQALAHLARIADGGVRARTVEPPRFLADGAAAVANAALDLAGAEPQAVAP